MSFFKESKGRYAVSRDLFLKELQKESIEIAIQIQGRQFLDAIDELEEIDKAFKPILIRLLNMGMRALANSKFYEARQFRNEVKFLESELKKYVMSNCSPTYIAIDFTLGCLGIVFIGSGTGAIASAVMSASLASAPMGPFVLLAAIGVLCLILGILATALVINDLRMMDRLQNNQQLNEITNFVNLLAPEAKQDVITDTDRHQSTIDPLDKAFYLK